MKNGTLKAMKRQLFRGEEMAAYCLNSLKPLPSNQLCVVIFAQSRTGSTLLEDLLCSTQHFHQNGELLNTEFRAEVLFPLTYLNGKRIWQADENFIFHVKPYHLTENRSRPIDPTEFIYTLHDQNWKVLHLKRDNKVKQVLSNLAARQRKSYIKTDDNKEELKLMIDCADFVRRMNRRIRFDKMEESILEQVGDHISVVYENDLEKPEFHQSTVDRILDSLSLERRTAHTRYRKMNTLSLSEQISNYEEFIDCIHRHNWQRYLSNCE